MLKRTLRSSRWLLAAALLTLSGANGCPLQVGQGGGKAADKSKDSAKATPALVASVPGDVFDLTVDTTTQLVIKDARGKVSAATADNVNQPVRIGKTTIAVADFCWRSDVVCPHQLLPHGVTIAQDGGQLAISFTRRGPLTAVSANAISGSVTGRELFADIRTNGTGSCDLLQGSAITATAYAPHHLDSSKQADATVPAKELRGKITVVYSGSCLAIGGSTELETDARLSLSMKFSAVRR